MILLAPTKAPRTPGKRRAPLKGKPRSRSCSPSSRLEGAKKIYACADEAHAGGSAQYHLPVILQASLELMEPCPGKIIVDGLDLDRDAAQIKKIIGVQLQTSGFYPGLNLLELINLFCGLYNTKTDSTKLLEMVNLKDKAKNKYKEMSGGQKQRFSIATTLINKPKIIFLDEPTTGLDPQARRNLWELIQRIRKEGTTVIITTHYMDEAEYLCDRVAIMDEGKIIALQSPDKLIDDLVASGFERPKETKSANLEDVFINLTGKDFRED